MRDQPRPAFKANCGTCGAEVIRHARNASSYKCFDCKRKRRAAATREWYRRPGNKERRSVWDKETKRFKQIENASNT